MSAIAQTRDVGFDSLLLRNESKKTIDTIHLSVSLITESGEEVVEKASFLVMLGPARSKRVNIGMGHVPELNNKAAFITPPSGSAGEHSMSVPPILPMGRVVEWR